MQIRWSPDAVADLASIVEYIRLDNPAVAQRIGQTIYNRLSVLGAFPQTGRLGRVEGTREFPLPPLPFIVIYRVIANTDTLEIVNIIHGAQRWPPEDSLDSIE
jgi:toxin ParE1/3/4